MFAQLGNIQFQNLLSFNEFSKRGEMIYAEHALIDGKPKLQRTGSALDELNISLRFHASFCNPKVELDKLKDARNQGEILPLLWGNGNVEGEFVIGEISETIDEADPQGNIFSLSASVTLKEYVIKDKIKQQQQENKKNAKAVGDKKPVAKTKTNASTCPQVVARIVSSIESHAAKINALVLEKGGTASTFNEIRGHNNSIQLLCKDLETKGDDVNSCVYKYPTIKTNATSVKAHASLFNIELTTAPARVKINNETLQQRVRSLKVAARPLINQVITRK